MKEGGLDVLPHLQYTNYLSLSDEESAIVSPVITAHTLMKKVEIKTVSQSSKDSLAPWSLDAAQIGKMVELGKIFLMYIVGMVVRQKREVKIY